MNVLIIGSGGREHAIAWKVAQSPKLNKLYIAPGNPGTAECGENVSLNPGDHAAVIHFCQEKRVELAIVGPEGPLADGIADALAGAGIRCFGPSKAAAQIEASKVFSKHFMARHGIPTARYATFSKLSDALAHLERIDYPMVIKASGLAAGKGVILPETKTEAESVLREMLEGGAFGAAGSEVVIEERMSGPEVSLMAFTDGKTIVPMLPAQDHKRIFDNDQGPNTGGMGAYAPAPIFTADLMEEALEIVLKPAVSGLRLEGSPFVGVLYAGLMLTADGLRVLEFNCRFGDPETQAVLSLLETDLLEVAKACVDGKLAETDIRWKAGAAVCVVLASKGYPEKAETGRLISIGGLPEGIVCFHAGTKTDAEGCLVTAGGRVLGATAQAANLASAVQLAYDAVEQIEFEGMQYRTDIAARALLTADESEKRNWAADEAEKRNWTTDEAEKRNWAADETEKRNWTTDETEKRNWTTDEAEKRNWTTDEAEKRNWAADEAEKRNWTTDEAEKRNWAADEAEKRNWTTDEAEKRMLYQQANVTDAVGVFESRAIYQTKVSKTEFDELTYLVTGLAMRVHQELQPGHREKFYQRRLAELCVEAGLQVEVEKRVEVWVGDSLVGYLFMDLWINEMLVVECKTLPHGITDKEIGQVITYLAATGSPVGKIFNFGMQQFDQRRVFPPKRVQDWQKHLSRYVWQIPGTVFPDYSAQDSAYPIRFSVNSPYSRQVEIPSTSDSDSPSASPFPPLSTPPVSDSPSASPLPLLSTSAYAASGVSIDAGNRAVELMKSAVRATYTPAVLAGIGSFGGLFDASALKQMQNPVLVASTDGVGTKVKLAAAVGRYRSIGHDIVNHCIDDILVQGARPLFFMDYFATSKLNPEQTAEVVTGIAEACKEAGMALLGGETAEMPGVYQPGEFDVAGTIVGVLEQERIFPRVSELKAGDILIGIHSSGPHTNGYSLIRKVFADTPLETVFPELGIPLADALLAPHRSYLNILEAVIDHPGLKALAHLTGGGFIENIPRVLPEHLNAVIRLGTWPVPPLWKLIQRKGNISTEEMHRVFNMGIGMVAIVDKNSASEIQKLIPETTFVIGELTDGQRKTHLTV